MVFWNTKQDVHPRSYTTSDDRTSAAKWNINNEQRNVSFANDYERHRRDQLANRHQLLESKYDEPTKGQQKLHKRRQSAPTPDVHFGNVAHHGRPVATAIQGSEIITSPRFSEGQHLFGEHEQTDLHIPVQNLALNYNGLWSWIPHVTQSADDVTVTTRVREVFVFADQFVNNFFSDRHYQGHISDQTLELANSSPLLETHQLQIYLSRAVSQVPLIKHTLMSTLLDLISFDLSASERSLLPREFRNFNLIAKARTVSKSPANEVHRKLSLLFWYILLLTANEDVQPALSAYRVLSAYIRSDAGDDPNYLNERQHVIEEVIEHFEQAFQYWFNKERTEADRRAAFRQSLEMTGSLGIFLFSQPAVFFFDWEMTSKDRSALLIPMWPRLLRVFDNNAQFKEVSDHLIPMKCAAIFSVSNPKLGQSQNMICTYQDGSQPESLASRDEYRERRALAEGNGGYWTSEASPQAIQNVSTTYAHQHLEAQNPMAQNAVAGSAGMESPNNFQHPAPGRPFIMTPENEHYQQNYQRYAPQSMPRNLPSNARDGHLPPLRPPKVPHSFSNRR